MTSKKALTFVALGFLCFCQSIAVADVVQFNVTLDNTFSGTSSSATGSAIVLFDTDTGSMNIDGTFQDLGSAATVSHVHGFAAPGSDAGVLFSLTITPTTTGTFVGNGTIVGAPAIQNTLDGLSYINIHSTLSPSGEIRGHLVNPIAVPEPHGALFGLAAFVLPLTRRRRRPV